MHYGQRGVWPPLTAAEFHLRAEQTSPVETAPGLGGQHVCLALRSQRGNNERERGVILHSEALLRFQINKVCERVIMEPLFSGVGLKVALLCLLTLQLQTDAMEVTSSGPQTIQKAQGETVKLSCTYTPGPQDTGDLDIEWSNVSPDMTQKDKLLLSFTGGQMHEYGDLSISRRLRFTGDPKQGDASILFTDVKATDTATYQCKVKKAPGVDTRKVTLVVMVPPASPKCWVEGGEEKGGPVSLRCKASRGSTPLSYEWKRETGGVMPADATQDRESGELLFKNHTDNNVGSYMCEVKNAVGSAQCKYALRAYNPTNKAGVIAGAVIGALLLLLLLLLLIWLLVCCCHKRRYQKEVANEIREDAQAPESRPTSRNSSFRSVMGYRTHPGVQYSSVRNHLPIVSESGHAPDFTARSNGSTRAANANSLQYDHKYGYPV